jgi:integrase
VPVRFGEREGEDRMEESIYGVSVPTPRQFALDLARPSFLEMVLIKVLIFTGLRNAELTRIRLQDVDLD